MRLENEATVRGSFDERMTCTPFKRLSESLDLPLPLHLGQGIKTSLIAITLNRLKIVSQ